MWFALWLMTGEGGGDELVGELICQKSFGITPDPGDYTFNPNQWGDPDNTGSLCINVSIAYTATPLSCPAFYHDMDRR